MSEDKKLKQGTASTSVVGMLRQGWIGVACWMAVGLLLEGLLGYKAPGYLNDAQRRELFRLAHTHGTLLSAVLILAALTGARFGGPFGSARLAQVCLRIGSVMMPLGFLLAGVWHPEGDPGLAIWIVPPGALLMIFGVVAMALSLKGSRQDSQDGTG
ncbi:MAG: hypothetical protein ABI977_19580 [Acidobacteriota bacterium]